MIIADFMGSFFVTTNLAFKKFKKTIDKITKILSYKNGYDLEGLAFYG
jgi:hypothetical protein